MKNTGVCPKCGGRAVRIPDNGRYANGSNIYLHSAAMLRGRIPLIRYVCVDCGYAESWVEQKDDLERIKRRFAEFVGIL